MTIWCDFNLTKFCLLWRKFNFTWNHGCVQFGTVRRSGLDPQFLANIICEEPFSRGWSRDILTEQAIRESVKETLQLYPIAPLNFRIDGAVIVINWLSLVIIKLRKFSMSGIGLRALDSWASFYNILNLIGLCCTALHGTALHTVLNCT